LVAEYSLQIGLSYRCNPCVGVYCMRVLLIYIYIYIYMCVCVLCYYGCKTWSLTLREERKLSVFENIVLRRIFGPRRDEVTGE